MDNGQAEHNANCVRDRGELGKGRRRREGGLKKKQQKKRVEQGARGPSMDGSVKCIALNHLHAIEKSVNSTNRLLYATSVMMACSTDPTMPPTHGCEITRGLLCYVHPRFFIIHAHTPTHAKSTLDSCTEQW